MNSIDAMAYDIKRQLLELSAMPLPEPASGKTVIAGSGDSYAAALAAHRLSGGRVLCCHPADIISDPAMVKGACVYFVSISGKTRANVRAAMATRKAGATTVAVTADAASPLACECDSIFALEFKSASKTSGTIGFTASLLVCARIAANVACPEDMKSIYDSAARKAARLAGDIKTRSTVILGDSVLYPVAMYGALKCNEVFGSRATAYLLEDFCHAPLFGHKNDQVIVLGTRNGANISRRLKRAGVQVLDVDCEKYSGLRLMLYATFLVQHAILAVAKKKNIKECYFLQDKKLLGASSDIIY